MSRRSSVTRRLPATALALLVFAPLALHPGSADAVVQRGAGITTFTNPIVRSAVAHDASRPLRVLARHAGARILVSNAVEHEPALSKTATPNDGPDPALDRSTPIASMPQPNGTFEGNVGTDNAGFLLIMPPDTEGDVGPNHYVQWVNGILSVWTKDGTRVLGPVDGNTLWSGMSGTCSTSNDGDPIVQYDQLADRWMVSQFAVPGGAAGYHECIAVSQTPDPTGAYYRYDFKVSSTIFDDYPHFGVWPDGYYMSINQFDPNNWIGPGALVFERARMLQGLSARFVYFNEGKSPTGVPQLPADLDGAMPPPEGSPNYFVSSTDGTPDKLSVYRFHVDWATTSLSTFTGPTDLQTAPFDTAMCAATYEQIDPTYTVNRGCIPQPGTASTLDPIADRLMYRLAYRNFGDHEAIVANQTVDSNGNDLAGIRWYELRKSGTDDWSIYQQSTHSPSATIGGVVPDGINRWMGSIAMDGAGNIAVGYSTSGPATFPSLAYAGRLATDPLNTMPQGEVTLFAGSGSQQLPLGRWGDYSTMSIDPADDCTFWFTSEYYTAAPAQTDSGNIPNFSPWHTRIGSFRFPSCGA